MPAATARQSPYRYDHSLIIGDTYQPALVTVVDADGVAVSLVGATGSGVIVDARTRATLATLTVAVVDGAAGEFQWSVAAATTASLSPGRAEYSVVMTFADTTIRTLVEGAITIRERLSA